MRSKLTDAEDQDVDGCDADFSARMRTEDEYLLESSGGVGSAEEELDGCDIFFAAEIETADEDLPTTTGGVG